MSITLIMNTPRDNSYYAPLRKGLMKQGWKVRVVYIKWNYKVFSQMLAELNSATSSGVIIGFSVNAFLLLFMNNDKHKHLIAVSPSPFWKECLNFLPAYVKRNLGKKRVDELRRCYSLGNLKAKKMVIIYGTKEPKLLLESANKIPFGKKVCISGAGHSIQDYMEEIIAQVKKINKD